VRTSKNIATVRTPIEQSPSCSARKHASALGITDQTVRQILHCDIKLHPNEIIVTQDLSPADWKT